MKKVLFTTLSIIAAAAMMMVSCEKPDNGEDNGGKTKPVPATVDPELVGTWTIVGEAQGWAADGGAEMTESNNVWTADEVIVKGEGFKFVKDGSWDVNLGAIKTKATQIFADDVEIDLAKDGDNIAGAKNGVYSVTLNLLTKKAKIKFVKDLEPESPSWDYVMDIHNYEVNSEFHFKNEDKSVHALNIDPKSVTIQWKFYSDKWNTYGQTDPDRGYTVWCNRLGQIGDEDENGFLFRFNDSGRVGGLRFNSTPLGTSSSNEYVGGSGYRPSSNCYVWNLNEWHVLTVTADGSKVTVYDNGSQVAQFNQNTGAVWADGLNFSRFDISMTWDDGTGYPAGQAFQGYQAYTRIWNKALSAEEVAASLCEVEPNAEGLLIYWAFTNDEGSVVKNWGSAEGFDLDFSKALCAGQQDYVNPTNVAATWTDVTDVEGLSPVCATAAEE